MQFLKQSPRFDLQLDGCPLSECNPTVTEEQEGNRLITTYLFEGGLKITNTAIHYPDFDAYEWCNTIENTGSRTTPLITELWDADVTIPMGLLPQKKKTPWLPDTKELVRIYAPHGATWSYKEFSSDVDLLEENIFQNALYANDVREYAAAHGRSNGGKNAPFFNVQFNGQGFVAAVGWSGQWNARISTLTDAVRFQSKIEDTSFVLYAGEKIRTSSCVLMRYEGDFITAQNQWRRFLRAHFSPKALQHAPAPFCVALWGGMHSTSVLERIDTVDKEQIPVDHFWMDAGWYGHNTLPTANEYEGDWGHHTGDWVISPQIHPNGLRDVAARVKKTGRKFLLWFEPERVRVEAPIATEHPEYFIRREDRTSMLLNLGNPAAFDYCLETLSGFIRDLDLDVYRQDFNFGPLSYFRLGDANEGEHRQGITEIKHINGLYRLWDALLERFPHLLIDNCASGGRRIDIELLRRSIPLWRSDAQCPANPIPEFSQVHNVNFSLWIPYNGTGSGRVYDTYRIRSAYAGALATNFSYSETETFGKDPAQVAWFKERAEEYVRIRPYFYADLYPLTKPTIDRAAWNAVQWNRPENADGMLQIFRHEESPYPMASLPLCGLDAAADYIFTDVDDGTERVYTGASLLSDGYPAELPERRTAKIILYRRK